MNGYDEAIHDLYDANLLGIAGLHAMARVLWIARTYGRAACGDDLLGRRFPFPHAMPVQQTKGAAWSLLTRLRKRGLLVRVAQGKYSPGWDAILAAGKRARGERAAKTAS
jgi:hypothetical protein